MGEVVYIAEQKVYIVDGQVIKEEALSEDQKLVYASIARRKRLLVDLIASSEENKCKVICG